MSAKEMFENIDRYNLVRYEDNDDLIQYQLVQDFYYKDYIYHLKGEYLEIIFDKKHHYLNIVQEDCSNYKTITSIINMQIYKAINKQVEELGWNNER